jgi:hypothetical protein
VYFSSLFTTNQNSNFTQKVGLDSSCLLKKSYTFVAREPSHILKIHTKKKTKKKEVLHVVLARELGWGLI